MKISEGLTIGGNVITYVLSAVQQNEIIQIVSFVLSSITSLVIIAFKIWQWWAKAKADGKIDPEEIDEAIDIIEQKEKKDE